MVCLCLRNDPKEIGVALQAPAASFDAAVAPSAFDLAQSAGPVYLAVKCLRDNDCTFIFPAKGPVPPPPVLPPPPPALILPHSRRGVQN